MSNVAWIFHFLAFTQELCVHKVCWICLGVVKFICTILETYVASIQVFQISLASWLSFLHWDLFHNGCRCQPRKLCWMNLVESTVPSHHPSTSFHNMLLWLAIMVWRAMCRSSNWHASVLINSVWIKSADLFDLPEYCVGVEASIEFWVEWWIPVADTVWWENSACYNTYMLWVPVFVSVLLSDYLDTQLSCIFLKKFWKTLNASIQLIGKLQLLQRIRIKMC